MIKKSETLDYIQKEFNIDVISYNLISEIIDYFMYDITNFITILNNSRIDITIDEMENNNLIK